MEKQNKTQLILKIMNVLFWIVFIGLCIKTGTSIFALYTIVTNDGLHEVVHIGSNPFEKLNLSIPYFMPIGIIYIIIALLKTYIAYLVIKISTGFSISSPFTTTTSRLITKISHVALAAGIFQLSVHSYYASLFDDEQKATILANHFGEGGELLFLAGIIFIIAQVFKRGLEIQSENELTI
ncbi:MAG: DUF2975 domain-containing protein [Pedobacter sp.]|uniref:DUF2975 domain-containing protein n=1 Tax=Pedobacter sp. TaxID=1411316 RepID=UPI002809B325|nr:DUF2975 domain-containing protein [Pedobacter sp.]MDQ8004027.1 DUF2975 domain-containing protein [Pedobacter sp.]